MKKKLLFVLSLLLVSLVYLFTKNNQPATLEVVKIEKKIIRTLPKGKKKTLEERALYNEARDLYEYYRQVNPVTGIISKAEKNKELIQATNSNLKNNVSIKIPETTYINRGASNLGGRTRSFVVDRSDVSGNTFIAGGVSSGVFRTTNGGASWTKVSSNDEIHNVTAIVQDPRAGFENIWYYATGEGLGNSASKSGAFYFGQGIWQSTNGGLTWTQMPSTASTQESFNSVFDIIYNLAVHPITGQLYAAVIGRIVRFNGISWVTEIDGAPSSTNNATDIVITTSGRVYGSFSGTHDATIEGVWTSTNGQGGWTRINDNGIDPAVFTPAGRVVLALAPSNQNLLYVLFVNGNTSDCANDTQEADLWRWNQVTTTFTDFSAVLPSEGCDMDGNPSDPGNNPFSVQGGYDLVVSVKPDNENFVIIGGTNAYKKENINDAGSRFIRIGGYLSNTTYAQTPNYHPDIHALTFSPFNSNILFSGTDGGVHKTDDITAPSVTWTSLNNNYQTQQYYHVYIDPGSGSDIVLGGLQDNGTNAGGTGFGQPDLTTQSNVGTGDGGAAAISRDDACLPFFISVQNGVLFRDCPTFANITPEISPGVTYDSQFITYFHLDPDNNNALYYAALNTVLRTTDATNVTANTWTNLGDTSIFGHTDDFQTFSTTRGAYNPATSYLLMGGDEGHIYRLNDPQNVTDISSALDITPPGATIGFPSIVTGLAIHPTNSNIVMATYSNYGTQSIFLTTNATSATPTWTLVERNLSAHSIRSAAIAEVLGQTVYFVGTARGLYSSPDPTTTNWVREAPSEIGFALVSSLSYRPSDNHLLIGTHGNGMFEAIISDVPLSTNEVNDISDYISLFPNPTNNEINLKLPQEFGNGANYSIKNMLGQSIMSGKLSANKIDVSNLLSGMYFIEINTNNKKGNKKFIKK